MFVIVELPIMWQYLGSDGVKIFFSETDFGQDRGIETRDEPRHFGFGRDETSRLRQ